MSIAKTIRDQITFNTLLCIGANTLYTLQPTDKHLGGLTFKVGRNPKLKQGGRVTVTLDFNDTYTVKIESARGKVVLETSGIYCDQLGGPHGVIEGVTG